MPKTHDGCILTCRSRKQSAAAKRAMIDAFNKIMVDTYGSNSDMPAMSVQEWYARLESCQTITVDGKSAKVERHGVISSQRGPVVVLCNTTARSKTFRCTKKSRSRTAEEGLPKPDAGYTVRKYEGPTVKLSEFLNGSAKDRLNNLISIKKNK